MKSHFIFGRVYVYFQLRRSCLDYSQFLFLCVVPYTLQELTASPQLPVAHLQEREQRKPSLWILRGVQIFSLLTSCFLLPYGIQNSADSPDHTKTSARNIFLNVLCLRIGGQKITTGHDGLPFRAFSHKRQKDEL